MPYREKDDNCRNVFLKQIETLAIETMVYIDERGLDQAMPREYGYAPRGKRLAGDVSGKRFTERHSIIAGLCAGEAIAPWVFNGYCDTEVVLTGVKPVWVPELKPGMTLVMDNASFHKAPAIREAIEAAGCHLIFLPPYSPDLNPVAKRTGGHWRNFGQNSKAGFVKWLALYFLYSNWLTPSFNALINYETSYTTIVCRCRGCSS